MNHEEFSSMWAGILYPKMEIDEEAGRVIPSNGNEVINYQITQLPNDQ